MTFPSAAFDRRAQAYEQRWKRYNATTHRLLLGVARVPEAASVLDVGCGTGLLLEKLLAAQPARRAAGVDPSAAMLHQAAARLEAFPHLTLAQAEATALPFEDARFDQVVSASAFHFFPAPDKALAEMRRVLVPGGKLALLDWDGDSLAMRALDHALRLTDRAHVRLYRRDTLAALLTAAGFAMEGYARHRSRWWRFATLTARAA